MNACRAMIINFTFCSGEIPFSFCQICFPFACIFVLTEKKRDNAFNVLYVRHVLLSLKKIKMEDNPSFHPKDVRKEIEMQLVNKTKSWPRARVRVLAERTRIFINKKKAMEFKVFENLVDGVKLEVSSPMFERV